MPAQAKKQVCQMYINGEWMDSQSNHIEGVTNPATGETIAEVPFCTPDEVNLAIDAATAAAETHQ